MTGVIETESGARPVTWWRRPWVVPLMLITVIFLVYALPPYLGLDPAVARLDARVDIPWFYPLLVTHIFLGSIVLVAACLQVWPWLRQRHPQVHRRTGRLYVAALLPASVCVLIIAPMGEMGPNQQTANTILAILWIATTVLGFRAARARRFREHREWMLRSFALSFSIVTNRFWGVVSLAVFCPAVFTGGTVDPADLAQAVGVSTWMSWLVNLILVELWLHRRKRPAPRRPTGERKSEPVQVV